MSRAASRATRGKAKNISVAGLAEAEILESRRGKVRLRKPKELPANRGPATDPRLTAWEVAHHPIRVLATGGESVAAGIVGTPGARAEAARDPAHRPNTICARKKRAGEALGYNGLVQSWPEITRLARETGQAAAAQAEMFTA